MVNPYASPSESNTTNDHSQWMRWSWMRWSSSLAFGYPILLIAAFYSTWLVAWCLLGHAPRPSLDDPKSIGTVVDLFSVLSILLLIGFPAAVIAGLMAQVMLQDKPWRWRFVACIALLGLWIVTIAFLRWDPLNVIEWFFD